MPNVAFLFTLLLVCAFLDAIDLVLNMFYQCSKFIYNYDLIDDCVSEDFSTDINIHDTLLEGCDYVLLPQEVWNQLIAW